MIGEKAAMIYLVPRRARAGFIPLRELEAHARWCHMCVCRGWVSAVPCHSCGRGVAPYRHTRLGFACADGRHNESARLPLLSSMWSFTATVVWVEPHSHCMLWSMAPSVVRGTIRRSVALSTLVFLEGQSWVPCRKGPPLGDRPLAIGLNGPAQGRWAVDLSPRRRRQPQARHEVCWSGHSQQYYFEHCAATCVGWRCGPQA